MAPDRATTAKMIALSQQMQPGEPGKLTEKQGNFGLYDEYAWSPDDSDYWDRVVEMTGWE